MEPYLIRPNALNRHPLASPANAVMSLKVPAEVPNALTVDVEDYFQVSAFGERVCRSNWDKFECRVENNTEKLPDLLVRLVNEVNNPFLGLCMDIGHQHMFSELDAIEWVGRMDNRLYHIHLHDNDRTGDKHWPIGRGTIDFEPFYSAIMRHVPQATISLEVEDRMEVKMGDLRKLAARFASK